MNLGSLVSSIDETQEIKTQMMPAGKHFINIISIEGVTTKAGGKALKLIIKPLDYKTTIFDYINIKNDNPKAELMGKATLKRLAIMCGASILNLETDHLLNKAIIATVDLDDRGYPKIVSYDEVVPMPNQTLSVANSFNTNDVPF